MTPDDYQYRALATALPAALDAVYLTLGLCGEAGEVAELLKKSIRDGEKADHADRLRRELGDVLFTLVNLARHRKVDAETALRDATKRFRSRVQKVEALARRHGKTTASMSPRELDQLWAKAKRD